TFIFIDEFFVGCSSSGPQVRLRRSKMNQIFRIWQISSSAVEQWTCSKKLKPAFQSQGSAKCCASCIGITIVIFNCEVTVVNDRLQFTSYKIECFLKSCARF